MDRRTCLFATLWLCALPSARAGGWELRRDDLAPQRPPVVDGIVTVATGDPASAFPRYLNEIGVKTIRIRFKDAGPGRRKLSIVWSGGSLGPDRFAVRLDSKSVGQSRAVESARRPYAWNRDDFTVVLGPGTDHVLEVASLSGYPSAVELAGVRWAETNAAAYQPLCYESIASLARYEAELGDKGVEVNSPHLRVYAPRQNAAEAQKLSAFLEKAYTEMRTLYGADPPFRFSVEHYPAGHKRGWGGISGAGTIGYGTEALERFARLGTGDVRGFAGYTEEMSHGFKALYKCPGTYEALGVAVQEDVVRRLVPAAVADAFWQPEHAQWDETHRAYLVAGCRNPDPQKYPDGVLYTRILNDVFLKLRQEYGPKMWPDFFATVRKMDYPLHRASKTEAMKTYADIFNTLFKRDMRAEFTRQGIDLEADPPWGWQTYGTSE